MGGSNGMAISIPTIQGGTRLVFDSVQGITNVVEGMHETIARRPLPWTPKPLERGRSHGLIASSVYASIRGTTGLLREGTDQVFGLIPDAVNAPSQSSAEIQAIAALNGAFGDHLEATGNPLAIRMGLITSGRALHTDPKAAAVNITGASPHLVINVHGLGLSELSWRRNGVPGVGTRLRDELGYTPLYLRYNTGRHISTNGREFSRLLEALCDAWPVPVESLSLVGHSMGGLVIRSACWYAEQENSPWLQALKRVVFLGSPHHGSPLEKAGHAFDVAVRKLPYVAPLAIGRHRSVGVKDLRHGNLLDEDWQGVDQDQSATDTRRPVPLLPGVDYYFAVATVGANSGDPLGHILGDLLVRLDSAVGAHANDLKKLHVQPQNCQVFHGKNHFDLLDDERVHRQLIQWFQS
jgi:pimeloyl-ACP methyl ester carboxylesterase